MKLTLQHILFPYEKALHDQWKLFYRGDRGLLTEENSDGYLCFGKYQDIEFSTYFNGFSNAKWNKYTHIKNVSLIIDAEGEFELLLCGYSLSSDQPVRKELCSQHVKLEKRSQCVLEFPKSDEQMLSFEIKTFSETKIYGGYYEGDFEENNVRDIELALSTTTCWKEDFIKNNIDLLNRMLLQSDMEIANHLNIHIVDNGRTLQKSDFPDNPRVHFHPNKNVGGSGGFARGMIEALHQEPKATHILLMDDDVLIMPDSIYRTYVLLKTLRDEYKNSFISGAMLIMEEMNVQHEDIGTLKSDGSFVPLKPRLCHDKLRDNLRNEKEYVAENQFQAWWYCCIPTQIIEKNGLPIPIFIRGDDCEFSLRNKANIISMNGICVWHMGFYGKYSASMNLYQECRNLLIAQAITGILPHVDLIVRIKKFYRDNILKHDYDAAELTLRALEDFMRGPEFIESADGEKIVKENGKLNQKMRPLKDFEDLKLDWNDPDVLDPSYDIPRDFLKKWIYRITYNGHRFCFPGMLKNQITAIPFDFGYVPGRMAMKKTYLAVNPMMKTACLKPINRSRFKELQKRYHIDLKKYNREKESIKEKYRAKKEYLTSEAFWRRYLGLES